MSKSVKIGEPDVPIYKLGMPPYWELVTIGSVCIPVETTNPREEPDREFDYFDISSIDNRIYKITETKHLLGSEAPSRARQIVKTGDIVFSTVRTYLKNFALVTEYLNGQIASTGFCVLRPAIPALSKWIFYFVQFQPFLDSLSKFQRGTSYPAVRDSNVLAQFVPIPPIEEADRIVAEIEKQFSRLDEAVENLQRVKANLKRYKASVLKAAVEGKLTEQWRAGHPDVEPASQLLERILKERRKKWEENELAKIKAKGKVPKDDKWKKKYKAANVPETKDLSELPRGWRWCCLGQLLHSIKAGKSFKCEERPPKGKDIGVVKVSAVTWGEFNEQESKTVTDISKINQDYYIHVGDFLFSRANTLELVGTCVIVKPFNLKLMLSDKILRFDFVYDLKKWCLAACLRTRFGRDEIENLATGNQNSVRNISQTNIFKIRVPLPPLLEQKEIAQEIEKQLIVVQKLEGEVSKNMRRADRLRQSILKKAFSGQLVPNTQAYENDLSDDFPLAAEPIDTYGAKE